MPYHPSFRVGDHHRPTVAGRKTALQWGSAQKGLLLSRASPFSPAESFYANNTLKEAQTTGYWGWGWGWVSQQFIKWQRASEVGTAEWEAARRKAPWLSTHWGQSKASCHGPQSLSSESLEETGHSHLLPPVPTPQPRLSRRAGLTVPRGGPGCLPRKHGWLEHPRSARDARERFGEGCGRRPPAGQGRRWGT